ncbi:MAG: MipA/OmpV family protein, partial [Desulfobacteraceae bacterium]
LGLEMMFGDFETGLEVLHDLSSEKSGQEAEFSLVYPWIFAGFEFRPGLSVSWLSKKRVDYLYGVSAREAAVNRPVYNPGSSFEIGVELMIQKPLFGNFTLVGLVEASKMGSEISNSPIVDEDVEVEAVLGVMYSF